ncbi:MAG: hypothetical protein H6585_13620 [Flavobacteriales bacterium]|nr:hypothetical protein [Flavobacteriales bacterium]MCB9449367.1 hypothetical protein [Flavobacteriales bacterium]
MSKFFNQYESGKEPGQLKVQSANPALVKTSHAPKYVEHRMEFVARIKGVDYINHSCATGLEEVWSSLATAKKPVVWISGTLDQQADYMMLDEVVKDKVTAIVHIGAQKNFRLMQAFGRYIKNIVDAGNMEEAVHYAFSLSKPEDMVIFSPGCTSYGTYANFSERGREFKKTVIEVYKSLLRE